MVPNVIIKLNNFDQIMSVAPNKEDSYKKIRLFCKNDSIAISSNGIVPINMPDFSPPNNAFDYSDYVNRTNINFVTQRVLIDGGFSSGVTVKPVKYNYYL